MNKVRILLKIRGTFSITKNKFFFYFGTFDCTKKNKKKTKKYT